MPHGRPLPWEVHLIVVRLAALGYRQEAICIMTDLPLRSIQRILSYFRQHRVVRPLDSKAIIASKPARRHLDTEDVQVSNRVFVACSNWR
jgi:hypothetical protein